MLTPIETNTATMQALLGKIAGKVAGGGGVETCTFELICTGNADGFGTQLNICYSKVVSGEVEAAYITGLNGTGIVLSDVLKNSLVMVLSPADAFPMYGFSETTENVTMACSVNAGSASIRGLFASESGSYTIS